jgi:hypothetical protein
MKTKLAEKINEIKSLGWEIQNQSFTHPHNNDYIECFYFKSPRMKSFPLMHESLNLYEAESLCVARECIKNLIEQVRGLPLSKIANFFKENPDETFDSPRIELNLSLK